MDDGSNDGDGRSGRGSGRSWERSFPEGSVEGTGWMLDVLDDLIAYARHHGHPALALELVQARQKVSLLLIDEDGRPH